MDVVTQGNMYQRMVIEGFDAEALLGVVKDTRFEQRLLGGGHFHACVQRVNFPGFSLDCGDYSLPVFASGSFGEHVVAVAIALRCAQPMWANGRQVECGRLMIFCENQELDVRPSPGQWCWAVILVSRDRLQGEAWYRFGRELELPHRGWLLLNHGSPESTQLMQEILHVLALAGQWDSSTPAGVVVETGDLLLAAFIDAIVAGLPSRPRRAAPPAMPVRHSMLIRRAESYLDEHTGADFSVRALSAAIGVGERQMERIFQSAYGMGPCRWHHVARLNQARRLLSSGCGAMHVTDIASRLGFGHLGRFSGEYRQLFGESPRETLAAGSRRRRNAQ